MLVITSQFEWKQQLVVDVHSTSTISQKQQRFSKGVERVKEKVYNSFPSFQPASSMKLHFYLFIFNY